MRLLVMQRCIVYNKRNIPLEKIMNAKKKMILVRYRQHRLMH